MSWLIKRNIPTVIKLQKGKRKNIVTHLLKNSKNVYNQWEKGYEPFVYKEVR